MAYRFDSGLGHHRITLRFARKIPPVSCLAGRRTGHDVMALSRRLSPHAVFPVSACAARDPSAVPFQVSGFVSGVPCRKNRHFACDIMPVFSIRKIIHANRFLSVAARSGGHDRYRNRLLPDSVRYAQGAGISSGGKRTVSRAGMRAWRRMGIRRPFRHIRIRRTGRRHRYRRHGDRHPSGAALSVSRRGRGCALRRTLAQGPCRAI